MAIQNPNAAQGTDTDTNNYQEIAYARAAGAITKKTVVSFSISSGRLVATAATTGVDTDLCRGIALDAATAAGDVIRVCVRGVVLSAVAQGTINAGDTVGRSGTTAGSVAAVGAPTSGAALGVCLTAAASNLADIWVYG